MNGLMAACNFNQTQMVNYLLNNVYNIYVKDVKKMQDILYI